MSRIDDAIEAANARKDARERAPEPLGKTPLALMYEAMPPSTQSRQARIRELEKEAASLRKQEEADTKAWAERLVATAPWTLDQLKAVCIAARTRINELANDDE